MLLGGVVIVVMVGLNLPKVVDIAQGVQVTQEEKWSFEDYALPDLGVTGVERILVRTNPATRERELRFSTTIFNLGEGPFEVFGEYDAERGQVKATQRVLNRNNTWEERLVGYFVFHPTHNHWHVENMTQHELFTYHPDGTPDQRVANTDKMSFCMFDDKPIDLNRPGAARSPKYFWQGCDSGGLQGVSVGWSDTYSTNRDGQHLTITGLADGRYMIRSTTDPVNLMVEKDNSNNSSTTYIEIAGNTVRILPGP